MHAADRPNAHRLSGNPGASCLRATSDKLRDWVVPVLIGVGVVGFLWIVAPWLIQAAAVAVLMFLGIGGA